MQKGNYRLPVWLVVWLVVSSLIVFWDTGFVLTRPRSMKGGDLFWLFEPYDTYIQVDKLYKKINDSFVVSQSLMNLVENSVNIATLTLHFKNHPASLVVGIFGLTLTLGKTILYTLMDVVCNFCNTRHNDLTTRVFLYFLPNGLWIVIPFMGIVTLGIKIVHLIYVNREPVKQKQS